MQQKKRILCLHGNGTNAEVHSLQLRQLQKEFKDFEFIPIDGPISIGRNVHLAQVVVPQNVAKLIEGKPIFTWGNFFKMSNEDIDSEALTYVIEILKQKGPFYGILGFSQGAALAIRLASLLQAKQLNLGYNLQCFIFASGSMNQLPYHQQQICTIPTVHFVGTNDFLIDRSLGLTSQFLNPLVIFHNQGHKVPILSQDQIRVLKRFFDKEMQDWPKIIYIPKL